MFILMTTARNRPDSPIDLYVSPLIIRNLDQSRSPLNHIPSNFHSTRYDSEYPEGTDVRGVRVSISCPRNLVHQLERALRVYPKQLAAQAGIVAGHLEGYRCPLVNRERARRRS